MGFTKWFDCDGCVEITLILRDYKTVTGKLVKRGEKHFGSEMGFPGSLKPCPHEEEKCEFVLLELTRDAESVSILEVENECHNIEIKIANVAFPKGTCIAINVCDVIYAGMNAEIREKRIEL